MTSGVIPQQDYDFLFEAGVSGVFGPGTEMKSTGEAIHFIDDLKDPFFKKVYSERSLYLSR